MRGCKGEGEGEGSCWWTVEGGCLMFQFICVDANIEPAV